MREAILVSHPAPVRHVPRGARNERLSIARVATPAMLATLDPDAFDTPRGADGEPVSTSLRLREGRLWTPLRVAADGAGRGVTADEFRSFLRGAMPNDHPLIDGIAKTLQRSALVARHAVERKPGVTEVVIDTGRPLDVDASRSIAYDGREACARATADFVANDLALVADSAWIRVRPLVRYEHDCQTHRLTILRHPYGRPSATLHFALDRDLIREGVASFRADWERAPDWSEPLRRLLEALPEGHDPDADLAYLANLLPEESFRIAPKPYESIRGFDAIEAIRARLLPFRYAGITGRVADAEAAEVLRGVREVAATYVEHNRRGDSLYFMERVLRHLDRSVMPRLDARERTDAAGIEAVAVPR